MLARPASIRCTGLLLGVITALAAAAPASAALQAGCTRGDDTVACLYSFTGAQQRFTPRPYTQTVDVDAIGGRGSGGASAALVSGELDVVPSSPLVVVVGGDADNGDGGYNGGGSNASFSGGGGASDIRTVTCGASGCPGTVTSLKSRLVVAGGSGSFAEAGTDGEDGGTGTRDGKGGRAGSATGGGSAGAGATGEPGDDPGHNGGPGTRGFGGNGGNGAPGNDDGGGGGGGLFGGGGGGGSAAEGGFAGGSAGSGGGGSSLAPPGGTVDIDPGDAEVVITYELFSADVAVTCAPASVAIGQGTTCTAVVSDIGGGAVRPTGSVSLSAFPAGALSASSCTLQADPAHAERASCSITDVPSMTGTQTVMASYAGDDDHAASGGQTDVTVTLRAVSSTLGCAPSPAVGERSACTTTLTDSSAGTKRTPTGNIHITGGGQQIGSCTVAASSTLGKAGCAVGFTPSETGTRTLTSAYSGDAAHDAETIREAVTVTPPPSTTTTTTTTTTPPTTTTTTPSTTTTTTTTTTPPTTTTTTPSTTTTTTPSTTTTTTTPSTSTTTTTVTTTPSTSTTGTTTPTTTKPTTTTTPPSTTGTSTTTPAPSTGTTTGTGAPPPGSTTTDATPPPPLPPVAAASFAKTGKAKLKRGKVSLGRSVRCDGSVCKLSVALTLKGTRLGGSSASVPGGKTVAVTAKLNAKGKKLLKRRGRAKLAFTITATADGATTSTSRGSVKLRAT